MKTAAIAHIVALAVMGTAAFAQGASDPVALLRACSQMEGTERTECLERLSRSIPPPARPAPGGDNWIVSETTSPVNYSPIITATTSSRGGTNGALSQLSIQCRGGRTELVLAGPAPIRGNEGYTISYRVNDGQPVQIAAGLPSSGSGAAFTGDIVRLLQSLPEEGNIAVRLSLRTGAALEGSFLLAGLKTVREKVAAACKWPHAVAKPSN